MPTPIVITPEPTAVPEPTATPEVIYVTPGPDDMPTPIVITPEPTAVPEPTATPEVIYVTPGPNDMPTPRIIEREVIIEATPRTIIITPNPDDMPTPEVIYVTPGPDDMPTPIVITPEPTAVPEPTATPEVIYVTPGPDDMPTPLVITPEPTAVPEPTATPEVIYVTPGPNDMPTPRVIHDGTVRTVYITPEPTEIVTATPEPTFTPEPSSTPEPELTVAAVTKIWDDMDNLDGSRPSSLTVTLLANGKAVETATLSDSNGWSTEITDLPATEDGAPISYTWSEESVPGYTASVSIAGNTTMLTNRHVPELTQVSVRKVWDDNNNAAGMRPTSITVTLSNGTIVILNEANGWSATVDNLPTTKDGQPITYTWREQEAIGYTQTDVTVINGVTTFTNKYRERVTPPDDRPVPGKPTIEIPDYDTPLGIEVIINHVGDCFD
jgi:hypothetical protein